MNVEIVSNKILNAKFGYMELKCPQIASDPYAGRFFMISVHPGACGYCSDPILKRPFAVCDIPSEETFTFLYMLWGRGTRMLRDARAGDFLDATGPLGNYFKLIKNEKVALVAGGIGVAPMILTAKKLKELGCHVTLFYGGRTKDDILMEERFSQICDDFVPVTEDGSIGVKGFVTIPLKERAKEFTKIYACGPNRMLQAVAGICSEKEINLEVSLDEQMACGVGACLGCQIILNDNGKKIRKRCCVEGPVFDGSKVDWAALIR